MAFVLDNSVSMAWCFEDETTPYTEAVLDRTQSAEATVPAIWPLEVANALLVAERRGHVTEAETIRFLQLLQSLPISVDREPPMAALEPIIALGRQCGISSYDAEYLELAARKGVPLATQDSRLRDAAKIVGVPLLG